MIDFLSGHLFKNVIKVVSLDLQSAEKQTYIGFLKLYL